LLQKRDTFLKYINAAGKCAKYEKVTKFVVVFNNYPLEKNYSELHKLGLFGPDGAQTEKIIWEIKRTGPRGEYQVFNGSYLSVFGPDRPLMASKPVGGQKTTAKKSLWQATG